MNFLKRPILAAILFLGVLAGVGAEESAEASAEDKRAEGQQLSAFEAALLHEQSVRTHESIVQIGSRKFRKVEFNGDTFYLGLLAEQATNADLVLLCNEQEAQRFNRESPALITIAAKVMRRTRLFVEGLRTTCLGSKNQRKIDLRPEIAIGFMLDDSDDPKALLKNRKITINPFASALGFSAEF